MSGDEFVVEEENGRARPEGSWFGLRITHAPIKKTSLGALTVPYEAGQQVMVQRLDKVKGWAPLYGRYEEAKAGSSQPRSVRGKPVFPTYQRKEPYQRFWRAKVLLNDGKGFIHEQTFMLQAAMAHEARTLQNIGEYMENLSTAIEHAERFNHHLIRSGGGGPGFDAVSIPGVKVAAPVVCEVFKSAVTDLVQDGQVVLMVPYSSPEVQKFVYNGSEEYMEIPQAFFHHADFVSDRRTWVTDIQGVDLDDGEFLLVDPCIMTAPRPTPANLIGTLFSFGKKEESKSEANTLMSQEHFEALHERCGPTCKTFDPQRKGGQAKRHCGMALPTCGMAGA